MAVTYRGAITEQRTFVLELQQFDKLFNPLFVHFVGSMHAHLAFSVVVFCFTLCLEKF